MRHWQQAAACDLRDVLPGYSSGSGESVGIERQVSGGSTEGNGGGSHQRQGEEVSQRGWDAFDAVEGIMALQGTGSLISGNSQAVESTMDSGAAGVVAPHSFAAEYETNSSAGTRGAKYRIARGNVGMG